MSFLSVIVLIGCVGLLVYEVYKLVGFLKKRKLLKKQELEEKSKQSSSPDNSQKN